jgi:hypothetical protein
VERGAWSVERGAWSVERGAWSVERGAWSVERPITKSRVESVQITPSLKAETQNSLNKICPQPVLP